MFFSDVRKLFYKDVEDDKNLSTVINAGNDDSNTAGPAEPTEASNEQVDKEPRRKHVRREDANGHTTRIAYGESTLPTQITFADGACFDFHYSDAGALETFFADGALLADYRMDPGKSHWKVDYADGTSAEYKLKNGRIISAKNASGTVTFSYDGNGQVSSETFQGRTVTYHRNASGHLIGLTTPFGQIIHYNRDSKGRICRIKDWTNRDIHFRYAADGAMESISYPNGTRLTQKSTAENLPSELRLTAPVTGETMLHKRYERDHNSRITRITNGRNETVYTYDSDGRLTGAETTPPHGFSEAFTIDAKANRLEDRYGQYRINPADRIEWAADTQFHYDSLGNLTNGACPRGLAQFEYTGLNCLASLSSGGQQAQYRYDALGRRVAKKANGMTTRYFWAGNQLLHEFQRHTTRGKKRISVYDYLFFPGLPALLAIRQGRRILWSVFGHRYEVLCLTTKDGRMAWQAEYDSFGQAHIEKGRDIFQPFRLPGQYRDEESGLYYSPNRYYDPRLGRYLSMTPLLLESGSDNFYAYGNGDPINRLNVDQMVTTAPILLGQAKPVQIDRQVNLQQKDRDKTTQDCFSIVKTALLGEVTDVLYESMKESEKTFDPAQSVANDTTTAPAEETPPPGELPASPDTAGASPRKEPLAAKVIDFKPPDKTPSPGKTSNNDKASVAADLMAPRKASVAAGNKAPRKTGVAADNKAPRKASVAAGGKAPQQARKKYRRTAEISPDMPPTPPPQAKQSPYSTSDPAQRKDRRKGIITHRCMVCGQVNALTGEVILSRTDFELAGRIPLIWTCRYQSMNDYTGLLGKGWQTPADARLDIDHNGSIIFFDGGLTRIRFEALPTITAIMEPASGALLNATQEHYQVRLKSGLTYHFLKNRSHTLFPVVRIDDRHDNFIFFDREDNQLTKIRNSSDQYIQVRSEGGRIVGMECQDRSLVGYRYSNDLLTSAADDADDVGHQKNYSYSNGVMVRQEDKNGHAFYFKYADNGRCIHCWDDSGYHEYQFDYRLDEGCIEVTSPSGYKKFYTHDKSQRTFKAYDDIGTTVTHDYDIMGRLVAFTDPLDRMTTYEYDEDGNITGITKPDAGHIAVTYKDNHRHIKMLDAEGNQWEQRLDEHGRLRQQTSPSGEQIEYAYNRQGDLETVTEKGITTTYGYDAYGQISSVVRGENNPTLFQRDMMGNTTAVIDADGRMVRYAYDSKGRLIQTVQPSGISQTFDWDPEDNLLIHTDPNGRQTRLEYGGGKITRRLNPDGTRVAYQYDTADNLVQVTNERGESWHYMYDPAGRVTARSDHFGHTTRYTYDAAGQLIRKTDPLERTVTYAYDALGRLASRAVENMEQANYKWDANGNMISSQSQSIMVERFYDVSGRLSSDRKGGVVFSYQYDAKGRLNERTSRHGNRVRYNYDKTGAVSTIRINDQPPVVFKRNTRGQITDEHFSGYMHRTSSYDQDGLLICQIISSANGEIERRYSYDGAGNLITKHDSHKGIWRYQYDTMDRITEASDPDGQIHRFNYDPCGDLLDYQPDTDQGLRCARYKDTQYYYDAAGNLVRLDDGDVQYHFEWDALNHLDAIRIGKGAKITMAYDALGRRHKKTVNNRSTFFNWEGETLVSEQRDDGSAREYVYYPGTRIPFAVISERGRVYYYHNDINGLPQELTRPNGEIVWAADYNAMGRTNQLLVDSVPQPLRLPGQYMDDESGLCYDGRRYFDPLICAYISPNPMGLSDNENAYAYGPNVWSAPETMGFCKSLLKKRAPRKRHTDIKSACVTTADIPSPQVGAIGFQHQSLDATVPGHCSHELMRGFVNHQGLLPNRQV